MPTVDEATIKLLECSDLLMNQEESSVIYFTVTPLFTDDLDRFYSQF